MVTAAVAGVMERVSLPVTQVQRVDRQEDGLRGQAGGCERLVKARANERWATCQWRWGWEARGGKAQW